MKSLSPQTSEKLTQTLQTLVRKAHQKNPNGTITLEINQGEYSFFEQTGVPVASEIPIPFHGASVGKLFTLELILQFIDEGRISLESKIQDLLPASMIEGLWVVHGQNYSPEVTINHLLTHTSELPDYLSGILEPNTKRKRLSRKPQDSNPIVQPSFFEKVLTNPDDYWSPEGILEYINQHLKARKKPGIQFEYSDTGYILLGFIIEALGGKDYGDLLKERIFDPAGMIQSQLAFPFRDSRVTVPLILPLIVQGKDLSGAKSLSCDWAGGGVITTTSDLVKFNQWFWGKTQQSIRASLTKTINQKFRAGIGYGLGVMELRLGEFSWFLRGFPFWYGHLGVTAAHLWYEPETQLSVVLNLGDTERMRESFILLIQIIVALKRVGRI